LPAKKSEDRRKRGRKESRADVVEFHGTNTFWGISPNFLGIVHHLIDQNTPKPPAFLIQKPEI